MVGERKIAARTIFSDATEYGGALRALARMLAAPSSFCGSLVPCICPRYHRRCHVRHRSDNRGARAEPGAPFCQFNFSGSLASIAIVAIAADHFIAAVLAQQPLTLLAIDVRHSLDDAIADAVLAQYVALVVV